MSDSVGKISLDLEVTSDINKQVGNIAGTIGRVLKQSINGGIKSSLDNMSNVTKKSVGNVANTINGTLKSSIGRIKNTLQAVFGNMKKFKLPTFKFPKPTSMAPPKIANISSSIGGRAPPKVDKNVLASEIDSTVAALDNINAKIEQQKAKLAQLREAYSRCYNPIRKNKLEEQLLKVEGNVVKLTSTSDKLGFKLADLDTKFTEAGKGAKGVSNGLKSIDNSAKKATASMKNLGNNTKRTNEHLNNHRSNIGIIARSMFTWGIVFPIILKGLKAVATTIGQGLMTNQQFANSFNQIKTNMMVAFTPILQAILPALNTLMAALARATTYIASFISAIFGKTYQQSYQATQQLIDAKTAMGAYGDSAKKASKDVAGLAAIDEINTLGKTNENIGGVNDKIPQLIAPPVDTSAVDSSMKAMVDKIKGFFSDIDFTPLKNSFEELKASLSPIVENIGQILSWFMENILKPLAKWTIEDALPAFFRVLAGAFKVLNPLLEVFMGLGKSLWDSFLQPIASWTGGVIVDVLNGLADVLGSIGNWISEHKPFIEDLMLVLGSFAIALGIVTLALKGPAIVVGILTTVLDTATFACSALGLAFDFLISPIGIAILAIGSIIAIGVLLYKHWDVVSEKAREIWGQICNVFRSVDEFIENIFLTDWTEQFGAFGDIINSFCAIVHDVWTDIKNIFGGIIDFIAGVFTGNWERAFNGLKDIITGVFGGIAEPIRIPLNAIIGLVNSAINGINSISVDIPDWVPSWAGGGKHFGPSIPKIPYLAKGGILDSPTLSMVGERGKEAVVPLENNTQGLDLLAQKILERMGGTIGNRQQNSGEQPLQVILNLDGIKLAEALIKNVNKLNRAAGTNLIIG